MEEDKEKPDYKLLMIISISAIILLGFLSLTLVKADLLSDIGDFFANLFGNGNDEKNTTVPVVAASYSPSSETHCIDGICQLTIYSGIRYVEEEGKWVTVQDAKSLMGKGFDYTITSTEKGYDVKVLDFNYTDIVLSVNSDTSQDLPVKIYDKEKNLLASDNIYSEESKDKEITLAYPNPYDKEIHIGKASTTIVLNETNKGEVGDTYVADGIFANNNYGTVDHIYSGVIPDHCDAWIMWNLSVIPNGMVIISANQSLYSDTIVGTTPTFVLNTSTNWQETNLTWNTQPNISAKQQDSYTVTATGWWGSNVTNAAITAYANTANKNMSIVLNGTGSFIYWISRENAATTTRPKLTVVYTTDTTPPTYQNQGTNTTYNNVTAGGVINLTAQGKDETSLDWAWLSTNETSSWVNYTSSGSKLLGANDATDTPAAADYLTLNKFTASATGNMTQLKVKASASANVKCALYADSSGTPGALITAMNTGQAVVSGWNTLTFTSTPITSGTTYWLATDIDTLGGTTADASGTGGTRAWKIATYSGFTFPNPAGGGYTNDTYNGLVTGWSIGFYNSPMNMTKDNNWQWSNFTWQNSSVATNTTVGWKIYYNDTSNNINGTAINTFCVGTCAGAPSPDTTPPTYTNFGANVTNNSAISQTTIINYYALWSDNNQSSKATNSSNRNMTSFINSTFSNWGTGNWTNYTVIPNLQNRENYTVKIYANDSMNNMNVTGTLYWFENIAPTITISSPTNSTYTATSIWVYATANEAASWCGRNLDRTTNVTMTNTTGNWNNQMTSLSAGTHNVTVYCNDTYNNMGSATQYFTVSIPIIIMQWAEISWYNGTYINITLNTWTYNNYTLTINNILVNTSNNYDSYTISSLAAGANVTNSSTNIFQRPASSDSWFNFTSATLSGQATGLSNNIRFIIPVDPSTKGAAVCWTKTSNAIYIPVNCEYDIVIGQSAI